MVRSWLRQQRAEFFEFLRAEVSATLRGRFGRIWLACMVLAIGVALAAWPRIAGHAGWVLAAPAAVVVGMLVGGCLFWTSILAAAAGLHLFSIPLDASPPGDAPLSTPGDDRCDSD